MPLLTLGISIEKIWSVLFPPACMRCGSEGTWLCSFCRRLLPNTLVRWCPACCRAVSELHELRRHGLFFDECWSFLPYHEPWVERAVHGMKFGGTSKYARVLGAECAARWQDLKRVTAESPATFFQNQKEGGTPLVPFAGLHGDPFRSGTERDLSSRVAVESPATASSQRRRDPAKGGDSFHGVERNSIFITAIPLSKKRERERGFNQAECIARSLCDHSSMPYERLLERKKATKAQAKLSAEERLANVADAFRIAPTRSRGISVPRNVELSGKSVVLVDDVITTGATLNEAARTLKVSGAGRVITLTVAYAVLEKD